MKKNLLLGLGMLLVISLAVAIAPSNPTLTTPNNNTIYFNDFNLQCSLPSDAQYLEFKVNESSIQNGTATNYFTSPLEEGNYNWSCRSCNTTPGSSNIPFPNKEGLLSYLSFDNDNYTNPTVFDLTLQNRDGTINTTITSGIPGKNKEGFNIGVTGGINIDDDTQLQILNGGTINMWTNISGFQNGGRLFEKSDGAGQAQGGYGCFYVTATTEIECYYNNVLIAHSTNDLGGHTNYSMITLVLADDPASAKIYVNGTDVTQGVTATNIPASTGYPLMIANRPFSEDRPALESIDEFSIYNFTMNQENITNLYNNSIGQFFPITNVTTNTTECSSYPELRNFIKTNFTEEQGGNALRLIFKNESNQETIFGSITTLLLGFDSDDGADVTYLFTNSTSMENWTFELNPQESNLTTEGNVTYTASGFQQRQRSIEELINGTGITNVTLYLLPTVNGIFVTFQTITASNQIISGVNILAESQIAGTFTEVASGTTDNAGAVTMFLNPNNLHRITATRQGYNTETLQIYPTSSTFTITMTSSTIFNQTNYNLGMLYNTIPTDLVLSNWTNYTFGFNVSSTNLSLQNFGFTLFNSTNDILISLDNTTSTTGGFLSQEMNTTNNSLLTMQYYWTAQDVTTNLTKSWRVVYTEQGDFSLKTFFDDLKVFSGAGMSDFTRAIIAFIITLAVVASIALITGIITPTALLGIVTAMTFMFEYVGMYPTIGTEWFLSITVFMLWIAFWYFETTR